MAVVPFQMEVDGTESNAIFQICFDAIDGSGNNRTRESGKEEREVGLMLGRGGFEKAANQSLCRVRVYI